jgi:glucosylceramidase
VTSRVPPLVVLALLAILVLAGAPALATSDQAHSVQRADGARHAAAHKKKHHKKHQKKKHKRGPKAYVAPQKSVTTKPKTTPAPATPAPVIPPQVIPAAPAPVDTTSVPTVVPHGWISTKDGTRRVDALSSDEVLPSSSSAAVHVAVDDTTRFQTMDGYGAALTESSAHLLMGLSPTARTAALRSLFDPVDGAGLDLVRLPLGASDFALSRYTYDDVPAGQTDRSLSRFSIAHDETEILPVLKEALSINPDLRVMATPWSAPAWMKTNKSLLGGTLDDSLTDTYAAYLTRAVQAWRAQGVPISFLTLGNEPNYAPADYPGMQLSSTQEAFLGSAVSSKLAAAGIRDVQLLGYDHNWDDTTFPTGLVAGSGASSGLAGTAFHCYAGNPSAQAAVHDAAPDKGIWFTECSGGDWSPSYAGNLAWNTDMLLLGATRNWAKSVLLWNLALSPTGGPHTGGCSNCRGVLTIDPSTGAVTRNVEYDVLALSGKAVRPGAVRVGTPASVSGIKTVAYLNPDGSHALTAYNSGSTPRPLVVDAGPSHVGAPVPAGSVVTLVW